MRSWFMIGVVAGCLGASSAALAGPQPEELQRLRQLKQENPEAFRQEVQERKAQLRERLVRLKETNPEAFQRVQSRFQEQRKAVMGRRLQELKARNPERYDALMQRRGASRKQRLQQFQQKHPEAFERFQQHHPEWRARREDRRDHQPQRPGRRR